MAAMNQDPGVIEDVDEDPDVVDMDAGADAIGSELARGRLTDEMLADLRALTGTDLRTELRGAHHNLGPQAARPQRHARHRNHRPPNAIAGR